MKRLNNLALLILICLNASVEAEGRDQLRENQVTIADRHREIALQYLRRNQNIRLMSGMLTEVGYQFNKELVTPAGRDCQQGVCIDNFIAELSFAKDSQLINIKLGVGIWQDFRHSFVWDLNLENERELSKHFSSFELMDMMGGQDVAYQIINYFYENRPEYISDSADRGHNNLHGSVRQVICIGPRVISGPVVAECSMEDLDKNIITLTGINAGILYEGLSFGIQPQAGNYDGREVIAIGRDRLQISIQNVSCVATDPRTGQLPGGMCYFFNPTDT